MNCRDISLLLDDCDVRRLGRAEREAVEAHLALCAECAQAWHAYERLVAHAVPEMPSGLARKVWQALDGSAGRRPSRRRFGRTALLGFALVGAAAAMTALELRELVTEPREDGAPIASDAGAGRANGGAAIPAPGAAEALPAVGAGEAGIATADPSVASADGARRVRLIVLPTRHENPSAAAAAAVDVIHDAVVRRLRSKPDLEVVELTGAQEAAAAQSAPGPAIEPRPDVAESTTSDAAADGPPLPPPAIDDRPYDGLWILFGPAHGEDGESLAIANRFGAEYVIRLTNVVPTGTNASPDDWSVRLHFAGPRSSGNAGTSSAPGRQEPAPETAGVALADRVYAYLFPASVRAAYESLVADVGAPEAERVDALLALSLDSGLSDAAVASAVDLGRSAASAEARRAAWELLGRSGHPAAVQPLIDALLFDPEAEVRREAADALFRHLDDSLVRSVLESAASNDPSPIVRLQAKWQYMTNAERRTQVAAALRDRTLTPEERMTPLRIARRAVLSFDMDLRLDDELRSLIVEAAMESGDPLDKKVAIDELSRPAANGGAGAGAAFVELLIEALDESDLDVRASAVGALRPHLALPGVRAALEDARSREPDSRLRTVLDDILTPSVDPRAAQRPD